MPNVTKSVAAAFLAPWVASPTAFAWTRTTQPQSALILLPLPFPPFQLHPSTTTINPFEWPYLAVGLLIDVVAAVRCVIQAGGHLYKNPKVSCTSPAYLTYLPPTGLCFHHTLLLSQLDTLSHSSIPHCPPCTVYSICLFFKAHKVIPLTLLVKARSRQSRLV